MAAMAGWRQSRRVAHLDDMGWSMDWFQASHRVSLCCVGGPKFELTRNTLVEFSRWLGFGVAFPGLEPDWATFCKRVWDDRVSIVTRKLIVLVAAVRCRTRRRGRHERMHGAGDVLAGQMSSRAAWAEANEVGIGQDEAQSFALRMEAGLGG
jgi:hypothetical protein